MGAPTRAGVVVALVTLLSVFAGCTSGDRSTPTPEPTPTPTPPPTATPLPAPAADGCHAITYEQALAPTPTAAPVPCGRPHTAETFAVDRVDAVVQGHLLAIDSAHVQRQVAHACPRRLAEFLGASEETMRLSMLRSVWFTPTLEEAAAGADWYRCDAIAVARDGQLAQLTGRLGGVLSTRQGAEPYAMCGTAEPGTPRFQRVMCREQHSWRALTTVDLTDVPAEQDPPYPGDARVREAGQGPCQEAGEEAAADALDYRWGYEWPTREQWQAGQTYGICWAPAS